MTEKWYETEEDKFYEEAVGRIKAAVMQGMKFEQAASLVDVGDEALKEAILDDALKVLIAEIHLIGKKPLKDLAQMLGLKEEKLVNAKKEMLADIEASAIEAYRKELGKSGNA